MWRALLKSYRPFLLLFLFNASSAAQTVGEALPAWREGNLDIHQISTGRGNAAFSILPDGTTLLVDAGDAGGAIPYADAIPNDTRRAGEWIAHYIERVLPERLPRRIDYAVITHFHADHMGRGTEEHPLSRWGGYRLSGITEVAEHIPIGKLLDRGWPDYSYPSPLDFPALHNYRKFLTTQLTHRGLVVDRFQPGRRNQIVLRDGAEEYKTFEVRNLAANGEVWSGAGEESIHLFPPLGTLAPEDHPTENMCSVALRIRYGAFDYFSGGDMPGLPEPGFPSWGDIETPIARAIGLTEVHVVNHHGSIDPANPFFLATLRPLVHVLPAWAPSHPAPGVLKRLLSRRIYAGQRDIFATRIREPTRAVLGRRVQEIASVAGHVVIRVEPGGDRFRVLVLEDADESLRIRSIHGPYTCQ